MASMVGRQASGKKIVSSSNVKGGQSAVTFVDTNYYLLNIFSSVAIVFVNKMLMTSSKFAFSTCLAALHFATCTIATRGSQKAAGASQVPTKDVWIFVLVANVSIVSLNSSLLVNNITVYQISKLMIIPLSALLESWIFSSKVPAKGYISMALVLTGVAIVSIQDYKIASSLWGLNLACVSVVSSALQQILVRRLQLRFSVSALELLSRTSLLQASSLVLVGPFIDYLMTQAWVFNYEFTARAAVLLLVSNLLALLVNMSQYLCLGRFSAVSFQVMGHAKTILVLFISWYFLGELMTVLKLVGAIAAILGLVLYSHMLSKGS